MDYFFQRERSLVYDLLVFVSTDTKGSQAGSSREGYIARGESSSRTSQIRGTCTRSRGNARRRGVTLFEWFLRWHFSWQKILRLVSHIIIYIYIFYYRLYLLEIIFRILCNFQSFCQYFLRIRLHKLNMTIYVSYIIYRILYNIYILHK